VGRWVGGLVGRWAGVTYWYLLTYCTKSLRTVQAFGTRTSTCHRTRSRCFRMYVYLQISIGTFPASACALENQRHAASTSLRAFTCAEQAALTRCISDYCLAFVNSNLPQSNRSGTPAE
jgi:hypothetical protein